MADTIAPAPTASVAPPGRATMTITGSGAATGGSSSVIISWVWNTFFAPKYSLPPMGVETAVAMGVLLTPIFSYILGWFPMPPARNRRT